MVKSFTSQQWDKYMSSNVDMVTFLLVVNNFFVGYYDLFDMPKYIARLLHDHWRNHMIPILVMGWLGRIWTTLTSIEPNQNKT